MRKILFVLLLISNSIYAQIIKGTVSDSTGTVSFIDVLVKKSENPSVIFQYTTTNDKGFFEIKLKEKPEFLFIEIISLAHEPKKIFLKDYVLKNNQIEINTKLESRVTKLREVILEQKNHIIVKKDTTIYNPSSFKDGTERVVEDLLKKLPGVQVKDDGQILYKGKAIKKLLLDGDDLFDSEYKIGSRNINVNMIDKVQGIDNYEENSLLKGIKDSDDVALNLVLVKGKTDFSGSMTLGYGFEKYLDNSISGVLTNSKIKGFGTLSHNNIGINNSPFNADLDFQSFDRNEDKYSKTLINQGNFTSVLDTKFHRINDNLYLSGNTLFKYKKKSSFKINFGYYLDNISRVNENNSSFIIGDSNFSTNEINIIQKKTAVYDAKFLFSNKEKENFHWEYNGKFNYSSTNFNDLSTNNETFQDNNVNTKTLFIKQNINSTYKISDKSVILSKIDYSKSNAPQNLSINPGTIIDFDNSILSTKQESRFNNEYLKIKSIFYSKIDSVKYAIFTEYISDQSHLISNLIDSNNNLLNNTFQNDNLYNMEIFSLKPVFAFKFNKFSYKISLNTFFTKINFEDFSKSNSFNKNETNFNPLINVSYNINRKSFLSSSYSYNEVLPEDNKLFTGIIQNNYRSFSNNNFALDFLKTHNYSLSYNFNDFFNLQRLNIIFSHSYRPNNYFSNFQINQNISIYNSFLAPIATKDYNINLSGEIYFHPLRTTFQLNSNYAITFDKNILNNSEIRDVKGNTLYSNLIARTKFSEKIILENNFTFLDNRFEVNNNNIKFQSFNQRIKLVYNPTKEFNVYAISNYILPDLSQNNNYLFLESEIMYNPKNKKYGFALIAKNLTNNKTFETRSISDFSRTTMSHNLIERYIMFKVSFSL